MVELLGLGGSSFLTQVVGQLAYVYLPYYLIIKLMVGGGGF
jgi:hypothetical protein